MSALSKSDLMFLIDELDIRRVKKLKNTAKYHKSEKGIEARKRASAKYALKLKTQNWECDACGRKMLKTSKYRHKDFCKSRQNTL
jgi:hypothetical protein